MRWTIRLRRFLRSLFSSTRMEKDLDAELRFHIQTYTDLYLARGLSLEEARAAALRDLGGLEQRKEECRDTRQSPSACWRSASAPTRRCSAWSTRSC
jgi:hypothetical protein